jgi:superfamily II DNA or RNA helicase
MAEREFFAELGRLEADPDNLDLPLHLLIDSKSMWQAVIDRQRSFPSLQLPDLIDPGSKYHPSKLMSQQKIAIMRAVGYFRFPKAPFWNSIQPAIWAHEENVGGDIEDAKYAKIMDTPEDQSSTRPEEFEPLQQVQREPPGSGKTLVLLYMAFLVARNALILTDNCHNLCQLVNDALEKTNISLHFPLKMVRSNAKEDGSVHKVPNEHILHRVADSGKSGILPFGGLSGIAMIDVMTFQDLTRSSSERVDLRTALFSTPWDLVAIDEADFVCAPQMRAAFSYGVVGDVSTYELQSASPASASTSTKRRYRMRYRQLLAVSGTLHRGDAEGQRFLHRLGPLTYAIKSRELEELGHLAKMHVVLVKCVDDEATKAMADKYEFKDLTPSKIEVAAKIINLHSAHGQKIMVFSNRHWHLRMLERMFPHALAPSGITSVGDCNAMENAFKAEVSQSHPLLWITIKRGAIGFDAPDTSVVINLVNSGESPALLRQRMGRASRKMYKFAWFYDLVGEHETSWSPNLAGVDPLPSLTEMKATRYGLLIQDGYEDDLLRLTSAELGGRIDAHIATIGGAGEEAQAETVEAMDEDAAAIVATAADAAARDAAFETHRELLTLDHIASCVWGKAGKFNTDEERRNETLFDTQSALAASELASAKDSEKARRDSEKAALDLKRRRSTALGGKSTGGPSAFKITKPKCKARTVSSGSSSASAVLRKPEMLSEDDYLSRFPMRKSFENNATMRKAVAAVLSSNTAFAAEASDAGALWKSVMKLRARANTVQFKADKNRVERVNDVLQMGESTQESCTFLRR